MTEIHSFVAYEVARTYYLPKMGIELNNFTRNLSFYADQLRTVTNADVSRNGMQNDQNTVKHSLKSKILERRKNLGLEQIKVDFAPKKSYPMTKEEIEKEKRRKQSNKESAQRCRMKQKEEYEHNKMLLDELEELRKQNLTKIHEIEAEKNRYLVSLRTMLPDIYIDEALRRIEYSKHQAANNTDQIASENTDKTESPFDTQTDPSESEVSFLLDNGGFTEDGEMDLDGNFGEGEILLASIMNGTEDIVNVNGNVQVLEVENEMTLQFLDSSLIPEERIVTIANVTEDQLTGSSTLHPQYNTTHSEKAFLTL